MKIILSKTQWEQIGKTAGWFSSKKEVPLTEQKTGNETKDKKLDSIVGGKWYCEHSFN